MLRFISKAMSPKEFGEYPDVCIVELTQETVLELIALQKAAATAKDLCPKPQDFQYISVRLSCVRFCDLPDGFRSEYPNLADQIENEEAVLLKDEDTPEVLKTLESVSYVELETACVWGDGTMYFNCSGKYGGAIYESVVSLLPTTRFATPFS